MVHNLRHCFRNAPPYSAGFIVEHPQKPPHDDAGLFHVISGDGRHHKAKAAYGPPADLFLGMTETGEECIEQILLGY